MCAWDRKRVLFDLKTWTGETVQENWARVEDNPRVDVESIECACEVDLSSSVQEPAVTSWVEGNEAPGSTQDGKFLHNLCDYNFLNEDSVSGCRFAL